ncbi:TetR/AcrR family transcriptional regulator [Candidatus Accumulibacter sp. ACC003]|uniref:TetR/AcrR family transcriptional regulator n=1 Tax=Candidatus Accumulibacter sp. ACC003 TaxID=2823334 RepID=UPI0025BCF409|nr:TetR/AcrR family transcriptional regulator [Candidatus Accumulibacter sp. ACC003]
MRESIKRSAKNTTTALEGGPDDDARARRAAAMTEVRRGLVVDAARSAFFELGLNGTSLREIAKRAGYTPGAIYSYFSSKEEIYAALLGESLARLNAAVAGAENAGSTAARVNSKAGALFAFYSENPRDLDLGFYLLHGVRPQGLSRELDAQLRVALQPTAAALAEYGLDPAEVETELAALFAHIVGLLVLIHTGRLRIFRQQARPLLQRYLEQLTERLQGR